MNLAQTANRLAQVALSEKAPMASIPNIEKAPEYEALQRVHEVLSAIAIASMQGTRQIAVTRPYADAVDTLVRETLEATGFAIDIDTRPGTIIINWKTA